jgi:hypothetical protein
MSETVERVTCGKLADCATEVLVAAALAATEEAAADGPGEV